MKPATEIVRLAPQRQESPYICSACGADRGCDCNAPAVERLKAKHEQDRQRSKAYRERKTASRDAPAENIKESAPKLNVIGKPYGENYDPNYRSKPGPNISRLLKPMKGLPFVEDEPREQAVAEESPEDSAARMKAVFATEDAAPAAPAETVAEPTVFQPNLDKEAFGKAKEGALSRRERARREDHIGTLITELVRSNAESRAEVVKRLASGSRQDEFQAVSEAVSDLYARLSQAGR